MGKKTRPPEPLEERPQDQADYWLTDLKTDVVHLGYITDQVHLETLRPLEEGEYAREFDPQAFARSIGKVRSILWNAGLLDVPDFYHADPGRKGLLLSFPALQRMISKRAQLRQAAAKVASDHSIDLSPAEGDYPEEIKLLIQGLLRSRK